MNPFRQLSLRSQLRFHFHCSSSTTPLKDAISRRAASSSHSPRCFFLLGPLAPSPALLKALRASSSSLRNISKRRPDADYWAAVLMVQVQAAWSRRSGKLQNLLLLRLNISCPLASSANARGWIRDSSSEVAPWLRQPMTDFLALFLSPLTAPVFYFQVWVSRPFWLYCTSACTPSEGLPPSLPPTPTIAGD